MISPEKNIAEKKTLGYSFSMAKFDPNSAATEDSGIFGLPYTEKEARLVYIPVPWEVTTSYGGGTSKGPGAILEASRQVDLYDIDVLKPYEPGLFMRAPSRDIAKWNREGKTLAQKIIKVGGDIGASKPLKAALAKVNVLGEKLNEAVYQETKRALDAGKIASVVGGDHAVPFGAFKAAAEKFGDFGILHFDAHSDTRDAYEGFEWSHASIMRNALERIPAVEKLVQVGIRDFCEEEVEYCEEQGDRVEIFFDRELAKRKLAGDAWNSIAADVVKRLPEKVWVSFDIDGLDPTLCPSTGTPVPGGLSYNEAIEVLSVLARSRKIIGFDLNEVSPGKTEWDANVGARMLYKMTAFTLASQGLCKFR